MGKAAPEEPPIPTSYGEEGMQDDINAQMLEALALMAMMGSGPAAPSIPPTPEIITEPEIDWSDQEEKLAAKMKADFHIEQLRRHGVPQTIHSSPLTDETDPDTTESILTGE